MRRFPALLALAIGGVAYDDAAKDRFHSLLSDPAALEASLRTLLVEREFDDVLLTAQGAYLAAVDGISDALPLCRTMERTRNTPLQQRAHFLIVIRGPSRSL